jgi:hypothetical protein
MGATSSPGFSRRGCPRPVARGRAAQRQQAIAAEIFDVLKSAARWPVVYIDDM